MRPAVDDVNDDCPSVLACFRLGCFRCAPGFLERDGWPVLLSGLHAFSSFRRRQFSSDLPNCTPPSWILMLSPRFLCSSIISAPARNIGP